MSKSISSEMKNLLQKSAHAYSLMIELEDGLALLKGLFNKQQYIKILELFIDRLQDKLDDATEEPQK